jgi:hypothetical protein
MSGYKLRLREMMADDRLRFKWLSERSLRLAWIMCARQVRGVAIPMRAWTCTNPEYQLIQALARHDCFPRVKSHHLEDYANELISGIPSEYVIHNIPDDAEPHMARPMQINDLPCVYGVPTDASSRDRILASLEVMEIHFGCGISNIEQSIYDLWLSSDEMAEYTYKCKNLCYLPRYSVDAIQYQIPELRPSPILTAWILLNTHGPWSIVKALPDAHRQRGDRFTDQYGFADHADAVLFKLANYIAD